MAFVSSVHGINDGTGISYLYMLADKQNGTTWEERHGVYRNLDLVAHMWSVDKEN